MVGVERLEEVDGVAIFGTERLGVLDAVVTTGTALGTFDDESVGVRSRALA